MADVLITTRLDDQVSGKLSRISKETQNLAGTSGRINALTSSFRGLGVALGAIGAIGLGRQFIQLSDSATRISSRLKLATDSAEELATAQERLFEISQRTRTSFASNVEIFQKFERATRDLHLSDEQLFTITERIGKAIAISGSSAESANAAIQQFTQGISSARFAGQELNSVLEQATPIAELLGQNLDVPIGKFRELAEQGFFTPQKVVEGLLLMGEGTKNLEKDFAEVAITADSAFTALKNALLKAVGAFNEGSGASDLFSNAILGIAKAVEKAAPLLLAFGENTARGFNEIFENTARGFREIEEAVKRLFSGLDEFFGGRLSSIVESVVRKVGEIGEAFRRLLDDVVGNSFVPELLAGIEKEFRGLDAVMVRPVEEATRRVSSSFGNLGSSVSRSVTDTIGSLSNSFSALARMIGDLSQVGSLFGFKGFRNLGATIGGIGQIASFGGGLLDKFQIGGLGGLLGGLQSKGLSSLLVGAGGALGLGRGALESLGAAGLNAPFGFLGGLLGNVLGFKGTGATIGGSFGGLGGGAAGSALLGGTFGGPIGAIAGGLLGTIFGGLFKRGAPSGFQERSFLPSGGIGITSSGTRRGGNIGTIAGTLDALGQSFQDAARGLGVSLQGLSFGASFRGENLQFFGTGLPKTGFTSPTPEAINNRGAEQLARLVTESISRGGKADPFVLDQFFKAGPAGLGLSGQLEAIRSANQAIQEFNAALTQVEKSVSGTVDPLAQINQQFGALHQQAQALQRDQATFNRIQAAHAEAVRTVRVDFVESIDRLARGPNPIQDILDQIEGLRKQAFGLGFNQIENPGLFAQIDQAQTRLITEARESFVNAFNDVIRQASGAPLDPFKDIKDLISSLKKQAIQLGFGQVQIDQLTAAEANLISIRQKEIDQIDKQANALSTLLGIIGPSGEIFSSKGGFLGFLGEGGDIIRSGALIGPGGEIIQGFQHGGDAVFTRPTPILVGETGPEAVSVTPLSGRRSREAINVNFNGMTVLDDISASRLTRILEREFAKRTLRFA